MIAQFIDFVLHLDKYLQLIVSQYENLTYVILFSILFIETGFIVVPFLPGDSLLFAAGALAATGALEVEIIFAAMFAGAVLGDTLNYHIGKYIGPQIFKKENSILFHKEHLVRAEAFYEKYGKKTIILARFIPIIRTFAPFVAGIGRMNYKIFLIYNVVGGLIWCVLFVFGGYWFGNLPFVQENFGLIIIAIIFLSITPVIKEVIVHVAGKKMKLISPSKKYKKSFIEGLREFHAEGNELNYDTENIDKDFSTFVEEVHERLRGSGDDTKVPDSLLWLVHRGEFIGRVSIRHKLNKKLEEYGGHIGYYIRPSKRKKGYGSKALELALEHARKLGIDKVLVTCDEDNLASQKIIKKYGGVHQDTITTPYNKKPTMRWWISI